MVSGDNEEVHVDCFGLKPHISGHILFSSHITDTGMVMYRSFNCHKVTYLWQFVMDLNEV